ncbi:MULTISPECIES: SDR family NAD(P)-dependent oxidoreductase [unclassified Paenibacillus]|uniref:SDR family NAD(P)-dependent oxidoreductase n=1 Tax=unclassified Paenibacillus TaxID=185978 RepID=UPI002F40A0B0
MQEINDNGLRGCLFDQKKVLITGAGAGIGRALALAYGEAGATVIAVDRNPSRLEETAELLKSKQVQHAVYVIDISNPQQIEQLFSLIEAAYGKLDIMINNAGFGIWSSPYDLTVEQWDDVLHTNLRGAFLCSREAAKLMRGQGGGAIINIASTRAAMSEPNFEAYAASKGGLVALTHALAVSLGPDKITVNAISPGWIETIDYGELRPVDHLQHPSGRVGKPEDIVKACFYLTQPDNDFVTGADLVVDGGMTKKMIYVE